MSTQKSLYDLDYDELTSILIGLGESRYRAMQIWEGLYKHYWNSPDEFSNLPNSLRMRLFEQYSPNPQFQLDQLLYSKNYETTKVLLRLLDGQAIESVLMRYDRRRTLCISTQVGCAMGCVFCATGQMGFRRHLTSGEIVEQVLYFARHLSQQHEHVTNVVIMGMGEPFHNYEATIAAIDRLNHPEGFHFGERRFTISTVGIVPGIQRFTQENRQVNLSVSLHAADDELRSTLLPINRKYPLDTLIDACRAYVSKTRRRITFEWALIHQVNDTPEQIQLLAQRLKGLLCHVNVIQLNPTNEFSGLATSRQNAKYFQRELEKKGIPCTIRLRRGIDIQAGCGQLAIRS